MRAAIFLLFFVAVAYGKDLADQLNVTSEQKNQLKEIEEQCIEETKTDAEAVKKFDEGVFSDTPELRCYYKCYNIKYGSMDKDGNFNLEIMKPVLPADHVPIVEKCVNENNSIPDLCDRAYEAYKCYIKLLLAKLATS